MNKENNINPYQQMEIYAGSASVPMSPAYLTKTACEVKAASLLISGEVTGMTLLDVAKEIFAHACCYYAASTLIGLGVSSSIVYDIQSHANPIDIEDGGDTLARRVAYELIWDITPAVIPVTSAEESE